MPWLRHNGRPGNLPNLMMPVWPGREEVESRNPKEAHSCTDPSLPISLLAPPHLPPSSYHDLHFFRFAFLPDDTTGMYNQTRTAAITLCQYPLPHLKGAALSVDMIEDYWLDSSFPVTWISMWSQGDGKITKNKHPMALATLERYHNNNLFNIFMHQTFSFIH